VCFLSDLCLVMEASRPQSSDTAIGRLPREIILSDDVNSKDYNTWVSISADKENNPKAFWGSVEKMKRGDHLYEYGIIINHNSNPAEKGKGSAIFFHVWRTPGAPTLGCTSMSKENLLQLMAWLDPKKEPLLVQAPVSELSGLN
jgi:L,D-peptidoglycan transpeptidase YkuD (ErfK/YbiS/YcfS/YnhG family)